MVLSQTDAEIQKLRAYLIERDWVLAGQVDDTVGALRRGTLSGRLEDALVMQRLITKNQAKELGEVLIRGMRYGPFEVTKTIGAGAMGSVYLGKNVEKPEQRVAIKVIISRLLEDESFRQRFDREISVQKKLRHPNIARLHAYGELDGQPWLAVEFVPGPSLDDLLKHHGPLPESFVLRMIMQAAEGFSFANEKANLIHRDIKPGNMLVAAKGRELTTATVDPHDDSLIAKIIDFGLAKTTETSEESLTMTGVTMGTPLYMSPEQIRGHPPLDQRSDVYALGVTMYHLLTGEPPFKGQSPGDIMTKHLTEPIPDPGGIVPSLNQQTRRMVMTALAKERDDRFASHQALASSIQRAIDDMASPGTARIGRLTRKPVVLKSTPQKGLNKVTPHKGTSAIQDGSGGSIAKQTGDNPFEDIEPESPPVSHHQMGRGSKSKKEETNSYEPTTDTYVKQNAGQARGMPGTAPTQHQGKSRDRLQKDHETIRRAIPSGHISTKRPKKGSSVFKDDPEMDGPGLALPIAVLLLALVLIGLVVYFVVWGGQLPPDLFS